MKCLVLVLLPMVGEDSNQERNDLLNECSGRWGHRPGWEGTPTGVGGL